MSSPNENDASYQVEPEILLPEPEILPPEPSREADPHWVLLAGVVGEQMAEQFDWVATTGTIETFEHRETYRYIHVDGETNEFLDQQCNVVSRDEAMAHALPPAEEPLAYADAPSQAEEVAELREPEVAELDHQNGPGSQAEAQADHGPGLDAFTRKHEQESRSKFWPHLVSKFDRFATLKAPVSISRVVNVAKHSFLAEDDSGPDGTSGGWGNGSRGDHSSEHKEPSLATFTRRTSDLHS